MRRYYHNGHTLLEPPIVNGQVKVPLAFCTKKIPRQEPDGRITYHTIQEFRDCPPGSLLIGFVDHGFYIVPPGGFVDLPDEIPSGTVKDAAPHLLTEDEYADQLAANAATKPKAKARR